MIPREILAQVRRIEIRTGRLVNETFAGKYLSAFKGSGMEFSQVREYTPGDEVRNIDWNVTARLGKPFIRQYQEERELTLVVACDLSASQGFGSGLKLKKEAAAELAAVLAFSALKNNDKVGLFLFTEEAELYLPPSKGRRHILAIIRDLLAFTPKHRGTGIGKSLDTLNRLLRRRAIVVLISDFRDSGFENSLNRTARKHDLIPVVVEDPRESELPEIPAFLDLEDPETGERVLVDGRSQALRSGLLQKRREEREKLLELFRSRGIEHVLVRTDRDLVDPIVRFFKERSRRIR